MTLSQSFWLINSITVERHLVMWWLCYLLVAAAADGVSVNQTSASEIPENSVNVTEAVVKDLQYFQSQYDKITDEYLRSFAEAQAKPKKRQRRDLRNSQTLSLLTDQTGVYRLQSIQPLLALCSPALEIKFIDVNNWTYTVCVSAATTYSSAAVYIGYVMDSQWIPLTNWEVMDPENVALLNENEYLYVLVADSRKEDGLTLVKYNLRTHERDVDHTVHGKHPTSVAIWEMKADRRYHMAAARSAGNKDSEDLSTEIYMYHWMGTYFDQYASVLAYDVKHIEPFHIHGAAYLAVANFRRGKGNFHVDSEIFKYNLHQGIWISHQKIRTYGAMHWEFFSLGEGNNEEFFLAVANYMQYDMTTEKASSVIYKFVKDIFVPFQCLETSGASSIAAYSDGVKFLLAIANNDNGVELFQYDSWRFIRASVQYPYLTMSAGVVSLKFHNILQMNNTLALGVSNTRHEHSAEPSLFGIGFVHENLLQEWHDKSTEWCLNTYDSLQEPSAKAPLQEIGNLFFVDQEDPIVIEGNLQFDKGFEAEKVTTQKLLDRNSGVQYDNSFLMKLKNLQARLEHARSRLNSIQDVLTKAVKLDGNQDLKGTYTFQDVVFMCESNNCHFNNITTTTLNGENVTNLKDNVVFLDEDIAIGGSLSVETLEVSHITVGGLVDGIDMDTVVTKSGNHEITGHKTFANLIEANDIQVMGLVDGIKFSPETVLLRTGHQNVTGDIIFTDVDAQWLEITGLLNGKNLAQFSRDVVLTEGNYVITGPKIFQDIVVKDLQMSPGSSINGVDVADLWANALWKEKDQTITASMEFSSIAFQKDLYVTGQINGIRIPSDEIVLIDENANITAPQIFEENAFINNLEVRNSINGITVNPHTGELDILMKTGDQIITGKKTFKNIFLDGHSFVEGTVNGVSLPDLSATTVHTDFRKTSSEPWIFNNMVIRGPLHVGTLTGQNLDDIYRRALKLNDTDIPNFHSFVFEEEVQIDQLDTDDINGVDVAKDLVLVNEPQVITGVKTFHDVVLEDDSTVIGEVNNINLSFLNNTLLRIGNQVITSDKTLNGNLNVKHLTVRGTINGINFNDVVTVNSNSVITGMKTLKNVTFNDLHVKNLEIGGLVNGIDVVEMMEDTLTYDGVQTVTGTKTVLGKLVIPGGSNLQTKSLNGIDLSALLADAVLVDEHQVIRGKKNFISAVSFEDFVADNIDGVTEWDMKHNWMLQGVDQEINADVYFMEPLAIPNVRVNGFINGLNITKMNETIVKTNEPATIKGPVIFSKVVSHGDIALTGTIEGIDLSREAVDKTKETEITGVKTFVGDLIIDGDLTVSGTIDGVTVHDLCENAVLLNEEQRNLSLEVVGNVVFEEGGVVHGTVAGVDINKLHDTTVTSMDEESFVTGLKAFESLTIEGVLNVEGKFGGVDIQDLNMNYMSLTRDQEINAPMHFDDLQIAGTLKANNFYTADQKINDIDIRELEQTVLKTTGDQMVEATYNFADVVFEDDVIVRGKVNELKIPDHVMRRGMTSVIHSPKTFKKQVRVLGDLKMGDGNTVQGVDPSEWFAKAVKKDYGSYNIRGFKNFTKVTANDIIVNGSVNGINFSKDSLLLTYGDQVITGKKVIHNKVNINGALTVAGLINGTNLVDLSQRAVRRDRNNTITGVKTFTKPLKVNALEAPSINGVDIDDLNRRVNFNLDYNALKLRLEEMDEAIVEMQKAFDNQAVLLQYYELFQIFEMTTAYSWLYVPTVNQEYLLLSDFATLQSGCTSIRIFEYDVTADRFTIKNQELISSSAVAMKRLDVWNHTLVILGNKVPNANCCSDDAKHSPREGFGDTVNNIYFYDPSNKTFLPYQSLVTQSIIDTAVFSDHHTACIIYLEVQDTVVYCAQDSLHNFIFHEQLRTKGGRKAALIKSHGRIMLAIASVDVLQKTYQQYVEIYFWDKKERLFGDPVQSIRSTHADSVLFLMANIGRQLETFLIISEGTIPRINNVPRLFIYKYDGHNFYKFQEIKDYGELDWVTLPSGDLIFFVLDVKSGQINIYQYKGASGFVRIDAITSIGTLTLHAFTRNDPEDMNHYLALAGLQNKAPNVWDDPDHAKILKSKFKGGRP